MLDILNKEEQSIDISDVHMTQIKEYLAILDLIKEIDLEYLPEVKQKSKIVVVTQPGLRYAQAEAIVENLLLDEKFQELDIQKRTHILERLLSEIRGRMMEDIVLLEQNSQKKINMFLNCNFQSVSLIWLCKIQKHYLVKYMK